MHLNPSEILDTVFTHVSQGRFQRSLSLIAGLSALVSGIEVAQEHYKGSYGQRVMFSPLIICALVGVFGVAAAVSPDVFSGALYWSGLALLIDGLIGFGFHIRGIMRKPGGFTQNLVVNIVMGPPIFAPLLLGISGVLGIVAVRLLPENSAESLASSDLMSIRNLLVFSACISALLNGFEALYSHYKTRFSIRSQWIPIFLSPLLFLVAGAYLVFPDRTRTLFLVVSVIAIGSGVIGFGFHANGIRKRPGGGHNFFYRFIYGPPLFAPMLFAASGFLGLLAIGIGSSL